jgi:hypothetical protein
MKTITIHQYWADAIFDYGKDVENRTWIPDNNYRGSLLIHAGKSTKSLNTSNQAILRKTGLTPSNNPVMGAIIGKVDLIDCIRTSQSDWAMPDQWHWILKNPVRCQPYYCSGQFKLWEFDESLLNFTPSNHWKFGHQLSLF